MRLGRQPMNETEDGVVDSSSRENSSHLSCSRVALRDERCLLLLIVIHVPMLNEDHADSAMRLLKNFSIDATKVPLLCRRDATLLVSCGRSNVGDELLHRWPTAASATTSLTAVFSPVLNGLRLIRSSENLCQVFRKPDVGR